MSPQTGKHEHSDKGLESRSQPKHRSGFPWSLETSEGESFANNGSAHGATDNNPKRSQGCKRQSARVKKRSIASKAFGPYAVSR